MKIERKNKKGISPVIATILLILITVAAVGILAAFIYPMVQENTRKATLCFDLQSQIQIETQNGRTCFKVNNLGDNFTYVQLSKIPGKVGVELKDVRIIFTEGSGDTFSLRVNTTVGEAKAVGSIPKENEAITYEINSSGHGDIIKVAIAPIAKDGNTESECSAGQPIAISACA